MVTTKAMMTMLIVVVQQHPGGSRVVQGPWPPKRSTKYFLFYTKSKLQEKLANSSGCDNAKRRSASGGFAPDPRYKFVASNSGRGSASTTTITTCNLVVSFLFDLVSLLKSTISTITRKHQILNCEKKSSYIVINHSNINHILTQYEHISQQLCVM